MPKRSIFRRVSLASAASDSTIPSRLRSYVNPAAVETEEEILHGKAERSSLKANIPRMSVSNQSLEPMHAQPSHPPMPGMQPGYTDMGQAQHCTSTNTYPQSYLHRKNNYITTNGSDSTRVSEGPSYDQGPYINNSTQSGAPSKVIKTVIRRTNPATGEVTEQVVNGDVTYGPNGMLQHPHEGRQASVHLPSPSFGPGVIHGGHVHSSHMGPMPSPHVNYHGVDVVYGDGSMSNSYYGPKSTLVHHGSIPNERHGYTAMSRHDGRRTSEGYGALGDVPRRRAQANRVPHYSHRLRDNKGEVEGRMSAAKYRAPTKRYSRSNQYSEFKDEEDYREPYQGHFDESTYSDNESTSDVHEVFEKAPPRYKLTKSYGRERPERYGRRATAGRQARERDGRRVSYISALANEQASRRQLRTTQEIAPQEYNNNQATLPQAFYLQPLPCPAHINADVHLVQRPKQPPHVVYDQPYVNPTHPSVAAEDSFTSVSQNIADVPMPPHFSRKRNACC